MTWHRPLLVLLFTLAVGCGGGEASSEPDRAADARPIAESAGGEDLPPAPTVTGEEARALVEEGAVLLDVTPPVRAEQSFIEGRTHVPLPELRDRMGELPTDRTLVVYCFGGRGSPRAGAILQAEGYDVRVMGARSNWPE
ncbi:MAG TPA: rhodanese-like domain-containing protein [Sandaracinaceae bacterium LLY-WYZ-13_1]|nr:rhodanese-like domain-containing protein [Sandaracinaceae bacterium LLY-WYZ-13_1]